MVDTMATMKQGLESEDRAPLNIVFGDVTEKNVQQMRILNQAIFPVQYQEKFYESVIKAPPGFVRMAYYNDILVAAVACRKEQQPEKDGGASRLYIMTLGVLAPYREHGIGNQLLDHVFQLTKTPACSDVREIYLHVHTANDVAVDFYKKHGFEVTETLKNYYKNIDPSDCYYVRKLAPF